MHFHTGCDPHAYGRMAVGCCRLQHLQQAGLQLREESGCLQLCLQRCWGCCQGVMVLHWCGVVCLGKKPAARQAGREAPSYQNVENDSHVSYDVMEFSISATSAWHAHLR